jgi:hypothetical protein
MADEPPLSGGDELLIEGVTDHIAAHFDGFGEDATVFDEVVSPYVHIDIYSVEPTEDRPWHTLITSGMAERPMTVPEGLEDYRYAEMMLSLPPEWPVDHAAWMEADDAEGSYWPVRTLKMLARLPHEYDTFLYYGHTVPHGDPPQPYAATTDFCCAWIAPPVLAPIGFEELTLSDGRVLRFLAFVPLYEDEMRLKLDHGNDALIDAMNEHDCSELLEPGRPSVASRR